MKWTLHFTRRALKDLRKLDKQDQKRVLAGLERFAESGSGDVVRLTDVQPPEWRLRLGDWRARFTQVPDAGRLVILRILRRDKAY